MQDGPEISQHWRIFVGKNLQKSPKEPKTKPKKTKRGPKVYKKCLQAVILAKGVILVPTMQGGHRTFAAGPFHICYFFFKCESQKMYQLSFNFLFFFKVIDTLSVTILVGEQIVSP